MRQASAAYTSARTSARAPHARRSCLSTEVYAALAAGSRKPYTVPMDAFTPLARAAHLRQAAFSLIAQLGMYPARSQQASLGDALVVQVPALAEALGYAPLSHPSPLLPGPDALPGLLDTARREYTRVFYTEHLLRPLGSPYLGRDEQKAMLRLMRELGMGRASAFREPADHLASEAELIAYCLHMERLAWEGADATSAREWHAAATRIWQGHAEPFFVPFARDVLAATRDLYLSILAHVILMTAQADPFGGR